MIVKKNRKMMLLFCAVDGFLSLCILGFFAGILAYNEHILRTLYDCTRNWELWRDPAPSYCQVMLDELLAILFPCFSLILLLQAVLWSLYKLLKRLLLNTAQ